MKRQSLFARSQRLSPAFTLVELLVVTAIIVVVMALILPALNGIGKSTLLTTAGDKVVGFLEGARQTSISKNVLTACVVVNNPASDGYKRVFTKLELSPRPDGSSPVSTDWKQAGKWEPLPPGLVLDQTLLDKSSEQKLPTFPSLTYNAVPLDPLKDHFLYVAFLPSGCPLAPAGGSVGSNTARSMRMVGGYWPPGTTATVPTYTRTRTSGGDPINYWLISILPASGRTKVERP